MDKVKFVVEDYVNTEEGYRFPTINIYINNRNLIELVGEIERRHCPPESGNARQGYVGFQVAEYARFRAEMLAVHGNPISVLLTCTCTFPECGCITAEISLQSEMVFWSEIQNPIYSSKDPWSRWTAEKLPATGWKPVDYAELGVFVFRREAYIKAVNDLTRDWRIGRWPRGIPPRLSR
jgi:hypothetical protein